MKKLVLISLILSMTTRVWAEDTAAVDNAQPRPASTVTADVLTQTTVITETPTDNGDVIVDTQTIETPSTEKQIIESAINTLPDPVIVDSSKNLKATMKVMGRYYKKIKAANSLSEMQMPLEEIRKWISQAEALGIKEINDKPASMEQQTNFLQGIRQLRKEFADLEVAVQKDDSVTTYEILNQIDAIRKKNHKYFDVQ